jgi:hypothetical protein
MQPRITGTTQVGRWTIEAKVGFGLKIAPKIRAKELSEPVVVCEGVGMLAIGCSSVVAIAFGAL